MASISQVKVLNTLYDVHAIEYIESTQASATNAWTGVTKSSVLEAGKVIAYKLKKDATTSSATLNLTLTPSGTTGAKSIYMNGVDAVTNEFATNSVILMLYDGIAWQVLGGGSSDPELDTTTDAFVSTVTATTNTVVTNISSTTTTVVSGVSATTETLSVASINGNKLVLSAPTVVTSISPTTSSAVSSLSSSTASAVTGITYTTEMAVTGVATTNNLPSAMGVYF